VRHGQACRESSECPGVPGEAPGKPPGPAGKPRVAGGDSLVEWRVPVVAR